MFFPLTRGFFIACQRKTTKVWPKGQDGQSNLQNVDSPKKRRLLFHFGRVNFNHVPRKLPSKRYRSHPKTSPEPSLVRRNRISKRKNSALFFLPPKKNGRDGFVVCRCRMVVALCSQPRRAIIWMWWSICYALVLTRTHCYAMGLNESRIIKFSIFEGSNNANGWWFWGLSL